MKRICVFCGARVGKNPLYQEAATELGKVLALNNIDLVYGGGNNGLMGLIADSTIDNGGHAYGVIPKALVDKEEAHSHLTEQFVVNTMHERKMMMATLSDGFIAMPGGFGTLEEFIEIVTWAKLGFHRKPCALLNINHFYDGLLTFFDQLVEEGFLEAKMHQLVLTGESAQVVLEKMKQYTPLPVPHILQKDDI